MNARVRVLGEVAKADLCRLARRVAEDDDRALRLDTRDRCGERCPAGRFEDQREGALRLVDALDDLVGPAQMRGRARGWPTTAVTRAPDRAAIWVARCPTPPAAPVISTRLPSSGAPWRKVRNAVSPATGKAAASSKRDIVGQRRHAVGGHGGALRPARIVGQRDDARCRRSGRSPSAAALYHHAADVLAGPPALGPGLQTAAIRRGSAKRPAPRPAPRSARAAARQPRAIRPALRRWGC